MTVDVPGVITSLLRRPVSTACIFSGTMIVYYGLLMEMIIHIGVGSDVVCSTIIGNARASEGGIDNRRFHALFMSILLLTSNDIEADMNALLNAHTKRGCDSQLSSYLVWVGVKFSNAKEEKFLINDTSQIGSKKFDFSIE